MIDLENVSKSYDKGQPAVSHATLHVDKGEFVFVVGSSGSGKSTLIKLLLKDSCQWTEIKHDEEASNSEVSQEIRSCFPGFPSVKRQKCL